jgi:hypothetical protein
MMTKLNALERNRVNFGKLPLDSQKTIVLSRKRFTDLGKDKEATKAAHMLRYRYESTGVEFLLDVLASDRAYLWQIESALISICANKLEFPNTRNLNRVQRARARKTLIRLLGSHNSRVVSATIRWLAVAPEIMKIGLADIVMYATRGIPIVRVCALEYMAKI